MKIILIQGRTDIGAVPLRRKEDFAWADAHGLEVEVTAKVNNNGYDLPPNARGWMRWNSTASDLARMEPTMRIRAIVPIPQPTRVQRFWNAFTRIFA